MKKSVLMATFLILLSSQTVVAKTPWWDFKGKKLKKERLDKLQNIDIDIVKHREKVMSLFSDLRPGSHSHERVEKGWGDYTQYRIDCRHTSSVRFESRDSSNITLNYVNACTETISKRDTTRSKWRKVSSEDNKDNGKKCDLDVIDMDFNRSTPESELIHVLCDDNKECVYTHSKVTGKSFHDSSCAIYGSSHSQLNQLMSTFEELKSLYLDKEKLQ